jgi:ribose transport system ATP-binding protein
MTSPAAEPLLEVRGITKTFPGVRALENVDLAVYPSEVVAVIGENGAGKSTLMKILAGVQTPDQGTVSFAGKPVHIGSVSDALRLGISLIHQELNLADNLDVGANIFLGREPHRFGLVQRRVIQREAKRYLDMVGLSVDPRHIVRGLSIGQQQMVEIAKALSVDAKILIMDEPTSSLSSGESERLFEVIQQLRDRGIGIVYISHRLGEVKMLADRVVVLRDGQNAGVLSREKISHDTMVQHMVGRDISQFYARKSHTLGDVVLEVKDLVTEAWPHHQLNFAVRAGEIVGVAGLVGAGRTEMLRALFGVDKILHGQIFVDGKPLQVRSPRDAIARGVALVPEDRKQHGLVLEMSVRHNIGLAGLKFNQRAVGFLNRRKERSDTQQMIQKLSIKTPSGEQVARFLSGGNQQKVVIGKWLSLGPRVLLLDEPTRGIDIGAKEEIYRLVESLAAQGMAILFVSSEMEEILGLSDRVLVMHDGELSGELKRNQLSEEAVMQLATGAK